MPFRYQLMRFRKTAINSRQKNG